MMRPVHRVMKIFIALCLSAPAVSFTEARSIMRSGEDTVRATGSGSADPRPDQRGTGSFHIVPTASTRSLDGNELLKIGDLHEVQGHLLEAMPYYRRALSVFRTKKDQRGEATALVRIGRIQERQERYAEAYASLQESMPLLVAMEDVPRAKSFMTLGRIAEALGKAAEAQSAYEQAKTLFQQAQDRPGFSESLIRLGSLLIAQERAKDGLAALKAALKDAG
ncbi:MAG: tetratricopeptide repeat protein, partial [Nitrospirae bacterium]